MPKSKAILVRMSEAEHAALVKRFGYGKVSAGIRAALFDAPSPAPQPSAPVAPAPKASDVDVPCDSPRESKRGGICTCGWALSKH